MFLVVDDEKMVLEVASEALQMMGFPTITAASGDDAVQIFREQYRKIDLVILDMIMPGMDACETFSRLKAIDPSIKVLLSSGYMADRRSQILLEQGCRDFIQKPFRLMDLKNKIHNILEQSQQSYV
jgi:CheY-like chemotaxis protein